MSQRMRWACRICLALGIDDPEQWLHECTPRKLAIWQAFYRFEPWGADMEQAANMQTQISGLIAMYASAHGADAKPQPITDFMPADWEGARKPKPKKPKRKAIQAAKAICQSLFPSAAKRRYN
jgi:hypothetical protein